MSQEQEYTVNNFSGGMNRAVSPLLVKPPELVTVTNLLPEPRGTLEPRDGAKLLIPSLGTSENIEGLGKFYRQPSDATDIFLAASAANVHNADSGGAVFAIDDGAEVTFAQRGDRMYATSWVDDDTHSIKVLEQSSDPAVSDVDTLISRESGLTAPVIAVKTADEGSGGNPNGWYCYRAAYHYGRDGGAGESNLGPRDDGIEVSDDPIDVTIFDANRDYATWADAYAAGVAKVALYRTIGHTSQAEAQEAADSGQVYWAADVEEDDAAAGVYTDDADDDDDLNPLIAFKTDHYAPPDARYSVLFDDRMVLGHIHDGDHYRPDRIVYSLARYGEAFPADYYQNAPSSCGKVQGFFVLNGQLYVAFETAIALLSLYGANSALTIITDEIGVVAPRSIAVGTDAGMPVVYFVGSDNRVYTFNGQTVMCISRDAIETPYWWSRYSAGVWNGECYRVSAGSSLEDRYYPSVRKQDAYTGGSVGTWWEQQYAFGSVMEPGPYYCARGGNDKGVVYFGSGSTGSGIDKIYEADAASSDGGNSYAAVTTMTLGVLDFEARGLEKRVKEIVLDLEPVSGNDQITLTYDTDFFSTYPNGDTGSVLFDCDTYRASHKFPEGLRCEAIQVQLSGIPRECRVHAIIFRFEYTRKDRP